MLGRVHRLIEGREVADAEHPVRRYRLKIELYLTEKSECSFGSDQQVRHVVAGVVDHVDVVAADPAQQFREAAVDLVGLAAVQGTHVAHEVAVALRLDIVTEIAGNFVEARLGAVGEDRVDRAHVVDHVAVADRARAAAVIGGHAADRRAVAGRDIDREPQLVLLKARVEPLHDDAGLHRTRRASVSSSTTLSMYLLQSRTSARPTVWPHCEVPPPRGNTGTPSSRAIVERRRDVLLVLRHGDAERLDLVDRGIGAVAPAAEPVEQHLAAQFAAQAGFEARQAGAALAGSIERHGS